MSENGKYELLHHFLHQHPLILTQTDTNSEECSVCQMLIISGETIYRCSEKWCQFGMYLHEGCAEMPREITHALHPQHSLIQQRVYWDSNPTCAVCEGWTVEIAYSCDSCKFKIHIKCAHSMDMMGEASFTKHPSHPQHDLKLLRRPGRGASIRCDACGVIHGGNSYICTVCQYCINESCAALGPTTNRLLHDHPLSLAYRLPQEYIEYRFKCDVCFKRFFPYYWVYHCVICRYVVHLNCAFTLSPPIR